MDTEDRVELEVERRQGLFQRAARGASERVLDIVDPDVVLEHVDVNALLDRVDVNQLLDRVDIQQLLDRVDLNRLLERVDIDDLLSKADVDALINRVDIKAIVDRAGIPEIVAESTGRLTGSALDLFRRPLVGLDEIILRVLNRLVRRDFNNYPTGPGELVDWVDEQAGAESTAVKTGRYAGPLTRLLAVVIDGFIVAAGFTMMVAGWTFLVGLIVPSYELPVNRGVWFIAGFVGWVFVYLWLSLAIFGKTIGKTILGVRVVGADGSPALRGRQAFIRTLTYPLSFAFLGLGLLGIVFGRERRAWHDHMGGSAVVYDWGTRQARMPTPLADWLDRRQQTET